MVLRVINNKSSSDKGQKMWPDNLVNAYDHLQIDVETFSAQKVRGQGRAANSRSVVRASGGRGTGQTFTGTGSNRVESFTSYRSSIDDTVLLPVPDDIQYKDGPKWEGKDIGILGRFAPEVASAIGGGDSASITDSVQKFASVGKVSLIKSMIKKLGADPNAVTQNINGKIANPYTEQVFGGIGLRDFNFNWKLVPRNRAEQTAIERIIRYLRRAALPDTSDTFGQSGFLSDLGGENNALFDSATSTDRWLTVPNLFNLRWKQGGDGSEISSLPKIKKCICTSIDVNYTPDNVWATHLDGSNRPAPVAIELRIGFGETEIIKSSDVGAGY